MEKCLSDFKPGDAGIVKSINIEGKIKRRLFDMGITPGVEIAMRKHAPLGDPLEVTVRDYELTLRKSEASNVILEVK